MADRTSLFEHLQQTPDECGLNEQMDRHQKQTSRRRIRLKYQMDKLPDESVINHRDFPDPAFFKKSSFIIRFKLTAFFLIGVIQVGVS
jgi:hypothetical protein